MKLEPLKKYSPKPVAILYPGKRYLEVQTAYGLKSARGKRQIEELLSTITDHCCFVLDALSGLIHTTGALSWKLNIWKGRETRAIHIATGLNIMSLRGTLEPATAWQDLEQVLLWLSAYGVSPGSIPAMAWSLFRASLPKTYTVSFNPEIGKAAFFGGRQEINTAGIYKNMQSIDIKAAYPAAMARPEGYALSLREVQPTTKLDKSMAGIAYATVLVPEDMPYAPLPIRIDTDVIAYQKGTITGYWPWCELAAAESLGAEVSLLQTWAPARTAELFGPWWPLVAEGRELPGRAGVLAKAISNSTWGQFGMAAEGRSLRQFTDDTGKGYLDIPISDHQLPHSWTAHIAAETTGRVRTQMLLEGIYGGSKPAHIDTDGVIVPSGSHIPGPQDNSPGSWRIKADIPLCDSRGPQLYRWTCPGCGVSHDHWHYNASGMPEAEAIQFFNGKNITPIKINNRAQF